MASVKEPRPLRRDARRNRDRLLASARIEFAQGGVDVPMEAIARRAGVGVGTLYRHFPGRTRLLVELWLARQSALGVAAQAALAEEDAWAGFCHMMREGAALQVRETAYADEARRRVGGDPAVVRKRAEVMKLIEGVVDRAQREGGLREDVVAEDIPILLFVVGDSGKGFWSVAPLLFERYLTVVLDGLRSPAPTPLGHPPLAPAQFESAIKLGQNFLRGPPGDGNGSIPGAADPRRPSDG